MPAAGQIPPPIPYYPVVQGGAYGYGPVVSSDDRTMGMLCHLLAIFTGFIGPLVLWLVKKDSSPYVAYHGREALNFQISLMIIMFTAVAVTMVLMFLVVGFLLFPLIALLPIAALVLEIMAAVAANKGEYYRYPCCLRLV